MRTEDVLAKEKGIPEPDWERFMGNNKESFPQVDWHNCGSISFKEHLGKQLSLELWNGLVMRWHVNGLCIYGENELEWCLGFGEGHCIIRLDANKLVYDIVLNPWMPWKREIGGWCEGGPAVCVVNAQAIQIIKEK